VGGAPAHDGYVAERLDHLGIVAGVCREIGLAEWLDRQDAQSHERVGVGTATVAMILNGLGFSNRRLYLVPQFFATKAVERLLGQGSPRTISTTTAWDARWTGCTRMIRRRCSPASPSGRGALWQIQATVSLDAAAFEREVRRTASFLVATNVLDPNQLSDQDLIQTYTEQHTVERGFAFLKDPLFLASSVFVKKPERIVALSLVMVLCLLVYRLAEHGLRDQLASTGQTVPNQVKKPTDRPTMRWIFQCFEGVDLLHIRHGPDPAMAGVLRLEPFHRQVLTLLGPSYEQFYTSTN
jgi:transposase